MNQSPGLSIFPRPLLAYGVAVCVLFLTGNLSATNTDLTSARTKYPQISNTKLNSCTLCHTTAAATNGYGTAYRNAGRNNAAFGAIENQDSDGDGFTNLAEINAGTFPGNSADRPQQATTTTTTASTLPTTTTNTFLRSRPRQPEYWRSAPARMSQRLVWST